MLEVSDSLLESVGWFGSPSLSLKNAPFIDIIADECTLGDTMTNLSSPTVGIGLPRVRGKNKCSMDFLPKESIGSQLVNRHPCSICRRPSATTKDGAKKNYHVCVSFR